MMRGEQKRLIINAATELACLIRDKNKSLTKARGTEEPDYYDFQTCYELMCLAHEL